MAVTARSLAKVKISPEIDEASASSCFSLVDASRMYSCRTVTKSWYLNKLRFSIDVTMSSLMPDNALPSLQNFEVDAVYQVLKASSPIKPYWSKSIMVIDISTDLNAFYYPGWEAIWD